MLDEKQNQLRNAVFRLAETGMASIGATDNEDEESAFIRGVVVGSMFAGQCEPQEVIILARIAQQISKAIEYRRSQGEDLPDGFLSDTTEEQVRIARSAFEGLAEEVERKFFDEKKVQQTMLQALDLVDSSIAAYRLKQSIN